MRFRPATSSTATLSFPKVPSHKPSSNKSTSGLLSPLSSNTIDERLKWKSTNKSELQLSSSSPIQSPLLKRPKVETLISTYPTNQVEFVTRSQIQSLYETAVATSTTSHQVQLDEANCGLLSLEQVLLPAVAQQEAQALKTIQAKAQRQVTGGVLDESVVLALEACRSAVYQGIAAGIQGARDARLQRQEREQKQLEQMENERRLAKDQAKKLRQEERQRQREERAQAQALERKRRKLQEIKSHPHNVELWREVALLMTEQSRLEKEERLWKQAQKQLVIRQEELEQDKKQAAEKHEKQQKQEISSGMEPLVESQRVDETVQSIVLSSKRIQKAIDVVSNLMAESDTIRKEIYAKYKEDHQFQGYRGVNDPKGLLRALTME